jgi:hypothetical protein
MEMETERLAGKKWKVTMGGKEINVKKVAAELMATVAELNAKGEEEERKRLELDVVQENHKGSIIVLNFRSVQGQRIEEMQKDLIEVLKEKRIVHDTDSIGELQAKIDARLHTYGRLESLYMFFLS